MLSQNLDNSYFPHIRSLEERKSDEEKIKTTELLTLIGQLGWEAVREQVAKSSYAEACGSTFSQPLEMPSLNDDYTIENSHALTRATELAVMLETTFPPSNKENGFYVQKDREKKVSTMGNRTELHDNKKVTRIYLSVPLRHSPEVFQAILNECLKRGIIDQLNIALNIEALFDNPKSFATNGIIIYLGENTTVLKDLAQAIEVVQTNNPELWKLNSSEKKESQLSTVFDLMLPLSDQVALVEMTGKESYHSTAANSMRNSLTHKMRPTISDIKSQLIAWKDNKNTSFEEHPDRRKYLPSLVFPLNSKTSTSSFGLPDLSP